MAITSSLRSVRAELGLSQAALAERVGVSRQTINSIETGRHDPRLSLAMRLAAVLGRRVDQIFTLVADDRVVWDDLERNAGA